MAQVAVLAGNLHGIPKLMEAMRKYGLREPEFRDIENGFRINLYRNTEDVLGYRLRQKPQPVR